MNRTKQGSRVGKFHEQNPHPPPLLRIFASTGPGTMRRLQCCALLNRTFVDSCPPSLGCRQIWNPASPYQNVNSSRRRNEKVGLALGGSCTDLVRGGAGILVPEFPG